MYYLVLGKDLVFGDVTLTKGTRYPIVSAKIVKEGGGRALLYGLAHDGIVYPVYANRLHILDVTSGRE